MSFTSPRWTQSMSPAIMQSRAGLPAGAFSGVRTRRMVAVCFDLVAVSVLSFSLWLALLVLTFGLSFLLLPTLFPFVAFFYNGLTVSGPRMGTPGMRLLDLELRTNSSGGPVSFLAAAVHAVLFYFSWTFPVIFLWSLFADDKRCLHDVFADVIIVRRL